MSPGRCARATLRERPRRISLGPSANSSRSRRTVDANWAETNAVSRSRNSPALVGASRLVVRSNSAHPESPLDPLHLPRQRALGKPHFRRCPRNASVPRHRPEKRQFMQIKGRKSVGPVRHIFSVLHESLHIMHFTQQGVGFTGGASHLHSHGRPSRQILPQRSRPCTTTTLRAVDCVCAGRWRPRSSGATRRSRMTLCLAATGERGGEFALPRRRGRPARRRASAMMGREKGAGWSSCGSARRWVRRWCGLPGHAWGLRVR